jgi:hypothetical protein
VSPPLRHPRAEQGAKRRSADPRIHSVTFRQRTHGPEQPPSCTSHAPRSTSRHGSSGRTPLRYVSPRMTKVRGGRPPIANVERKRGWPPLIANVERAAQNAAERGRMRGVRQSTPPLRHPRAEPGAKRLSVDPRIHAVTLAVLPRSRTDALSCTVPLHARRHGMDPRVALRFAALARG